MVDGTGADDDLEAEVREVLAQWLPMAAAVDERLAGERFRAVAPVTAFPAPPRAGGPA